MWLLVTPLLTTVRGSRAPHVAATPASCMFVQVSQRHGTDRRLLFDYAAVFRLVHWDRFPPRAVE